MRPGAGPDEVRAAWRRVARATHPDRGGEPERFRQAREAYRAVLAGTYRSLGPSPTVVPRKGATVLVTRWLRRRGDRRRRPRVV